MAARFESSYGLSEYDATALTQSLTLARYFEDTVATCGQAKLASNWIMGEISRRLNAQDIGIAQAPVQPNQLAALITRIHEGMISSSAARQVFDALWQSPGHRVMTGSSLPEVRQMLDVFIEVDAIIEAKGLRQMNDTGALEAIVDDVIAANAKNVAEFKAGNDKALNALVGQIMKASKGKANPQQVNDLLRAKLG
jgi:aspartyl-tRNA(Asn)/glutamyl-tRNA(Gln) amidotransferase subunit B